jgi:transcriptional regulator with XRE-family HTH domain
LTDAFSLCAPVTAGGVSVLRLTLERKRRKWSQSDLADRVVEELGVVGFFSRMRHQYVISAIELGRITPTEDELNALARALQIAPAFALLTPVDLTRRDSLAEQTV